MSTICKKPILLRSVIEKMETSPKTLLGSLELLEAIVIPQCRWYETNIDSILLTLTLTYILTFQCIG
jgi:hypothetical protein